MRMMLMVRSMTKRGRSTREDTCKVVWLWWWQYPTGLGDSLG